MFLWTPSNEGTPLKVYVNGDDGFWYFAYFLETSIDITDPTVYQ